MVTANMMTGACSPRADYQNSYKKYMKNDSRQQSPLGDLFCFLSFCFSSFLFVQLFLLAKEKVERRSLRKTTRIWCSATIIKSWKSEVKLRRVMCTPFSRHFRNTPPAPLIELKDALYTQLEPSCSWSTVFFRNCSIACIRRLLNGAHQMNNGLV